MTLKGGKRGLLVNSEDVCADARLARARMIGQNNVGVVLRPRLEVNCAKHSGRPGQKRKRGVAR